MKKVKISKKELRSLIKKSAKVDGLKKELKETKRNDLKGNSQQHRGASATREHF